MKLNFDKVEIYENISKTRKRIENIREGFADYIYNHGEGIAAKAIALKIYNGNLDTDFTPQEVGLIRLYSQGCSPAVMDAITELIAKSGGIPMEVAQ